jgi:multiple sugar transport system permease protein
VNASLSTTNDVALEIAGQRRRRIRTYDLVGLIATIATVIGAILWAFPLYWGVVTSLKPEAEVVQAGLHVLPEHWTLDAYTYALFDTKIGVWYINSLTTSLATTLIVVMMSAGAGYAISQLNFPGRRIIWWMILASFMVPIQALIVNHYVLFNQFRYIPWIGQNMTINTLTAVVGPQLLAPVTVIIYKQFFDSVPKDFREAAVVDGANEFQLLFRIYLPMNWGITTALAIITFIGAWNNFLWPFLAVSDEDKMNITVGITQVSDAFGVKYARDLATAILAGLPVAVVYLIFQRRVTQAIMLSAGIKG